MSEPQAILDTPPEAGTTDLSPLLNAGSRTRQTLGDLGGAESRVLAGAPLDSAASSSLVPPGEDDDDPLVIVELLHNMPSWLASMVVHLLLMLVLALGMTVQKPNDQASYSLVSPYDREDGALDDLQGESLEVAKPLEDAPEMPDAPDIGALLAPAQPILAPGAGTGTGVDGDRLLEGQLFKLGNGAPGDSKLLDGVMQNIGNSLQGRLNPRNRAAMVRQGGGTPGSETAVTLALKWLAEHQSADGGWNFDHRTCPKCRGRCNNPGTLTHARSAATAMALLPFLGTGQTHKEGEYKRTIQSGLYFLVRSMRVTGEQPNEIGSLHDPAGRMYGHGLAAIALCEAYGMTHDKFLERPAQASLNFIVAAQDPKGGGWRYEPGQAGDTSVVGWQLMALKSGHLAYLRVPKETILGAERFLDSTQIDYGAAYGYTEPGNGPATSAIGLLCRLYMGWKPTQPAMVDGVARLAKLGPSTNKTGPGQDLLYYNYYATQVMHHTGGPAWKEWNTVMRDYLIESQSKGKGHDRGSWHFNGGDHGTSSGGRLYSTAMSAMILEVYYRFMPIYREQSTKDGFFN